MRFAVLTSLIYVREYPKVIPVLFVTIGFGLVGFLDDYLKVVLHRSDGLMPMQKMALQIVITAILHFTFVKVAKIPLTMLIPFSGGKYLNIGWFAIPVLFIAVIGTVNGVNFTDGLDGLASSVTVLVATFFTVVAIGTKSGIEPITCAVVGALLGFLLFNVLSGKRIYGRHRITGSWGICCFDSIHAPDAIIHYHRRIDLSGRSFISYDPGNIF